MSTRVCAACGSDPDREVPTHEELPIVAGALDAQERAERKWWAARAEIEALKDRVLTLEAEIERLRS